MNRIEEIPSSTSTSLPKPAPESISDWSPTPYRRRLYDRPAQTGAASPAQLPGALLL